MGASYRQHSLRVGKLLGVVGMTLLARTTVAETSPEIVSSWNARLSTSELVSFGSSIRWTVFKYQPEREIYLFARPSLGLSGADASLGAAWTSPCRHYSEVGCPSVGVGFMLLQTWWISPMPTGQYYGPEAYLSVFLARLGVGVVRDAHDPTAYKIDLSLAIAQD